MIANLEQRQAGRLLRTTWRRPPRSSTRPVMTRFVSRSHALSGVPVELLGDMVDDQTWEASIREDERQRIADLIRSHRFDGTNQYATPDTWHAAARFLENLIRNAEESA